MEICIFLPDMVHHQLGGRNANVFSERNSERRHSFTSAILMFFLHPAGYYVRALHVHYDSICLAVTSTERKRSNSWVLF